MTSTDVLEKNGTRKLTFLNVTQQKANKNALKITTTFINFLLISWLGHLKQCHCCIIILKAATLVYKFRYL